MLLRGMSDLVAGPLLLRVGVALHSLRNLGLGGGGVLDTRSNRLGAKHSAATKAKISKAMKGKSKAAAHKAKISKAMMGNTNAKKKGTSH